MGTEFSVFSAIALGMTRKLMIYVFTCILVLLFIVTGLEKVVKFQEFSEKMSGQVFGKDLLPVMLFVLPVAEISCAVLLVVPKSRSVGFALSIALLTMFSTYIILILLHVFSTQPCPCGGPLEKLPWTGHLLFNLFFLIISGLGLILTIKERRQEKLT